MESLPTKRPVKQKEAAVMGYPLINPPVKQQEVAVTGSPLTKRRVTLLVNVQMVRLLTKLPVKRCRLLGLPQRGVMKPGLMKRGLLGFGRPQRMFGHPWIKTVVRQWVIVPTPFWLIKPHVRMLERRG